jgi:uncharacterized protein with von Willebrand factor type A (vWA) domain
MLIIPRTPTPESPPAIAALHDRDITTLSPDELRQLQQQLKESQVRMSHIYHMAELTSPRARELELAKQIKREMKEEDNPRPRKVARPSPGDTQLELGDDGSFRERSTSALPRAEIEIIELD